MLTVPAITVCIIGYNEEVNLAKCIASVKGWATDVWLVDSYSNDRTITVAERAGARTVQHRFLHWADQRNWALDNIPFDTEWVQFLDADEEMTAPARIELDTLLAEATPDVAAVSIVTRLTFLGRELERAYSHPHVVRVVRRGRARWLAQGAREYTCVDGRTVRLNAKLRHEDIRGLSHWLSKQIRNAVREANSSIIGESIGLAGVRGPQRMRLRVRMAIWDKLPGITRSALYFVYRYILCLGFTEGTAGFLFCFYHAFWLPLTAAALREEFEQGQWRR